MKEFTISVTGNTSELKSVFFPPIDLNGDYEIGLVDFQSYNTIFNVKSPDNVIYYSDVDHITVPKGSFSLNQLNDKEGIKGNIKFNYDKGTDKIMGKIEGKGKIYFNKLGLLRKMTTREIKVTNDLTDHIEIGEGDDIYYYDESKENQLIIPEGSYEVSDIEREMQKTIPQLTLKPFGSTMLCIINSPKAINFNKPGLGQSMLGFRGVTTPNVDHMSFNKVNINNVNVLRINCNIASGSYLNGKPTHSIHAFYPEVGPGFKIIHVPKNIIYFPINVRTLDTVTISIVDQADRIVNFHGEEITLRCHIRKVS